MNDINSIIIKEERYNGIIFIKPNATEEQIEAVKKIYPKFKIVKKKEK